MRTGSKVRWAWGKINLTLNSIFTIARYRVGYSIYYFPVNFFPKNFITRTCCSQEPSLGNITLTNEQTIASYSVENWDPLKVISATSPDSLLHVRIILHHPCQAAIQLHWNANLSRKLTIPPLASFPFFVFPSSERGSHPQQKHIHHCTSTTACCQYNFLTKDQYKTSGLIHLAIL